MKDCAAALPLATKVSKIDRRKLLIYLDLNPTTLELEAIKIDRQASVESANFSKARP